MDASAATAPREEHANPLTRLDGQPMTPALSASALRALDHLWQRCPDEDRGLLRPLANFLQAEKAGLDRIRGGGSSVRMGTQGLVDEYPVVTMLLAVDSAEAFPGLERLASIAVARALEVSSGPERRQVELLCQIIRGAAADQGSVLRLILKDAASILKMLHAMPAQAEIGGKDGHQGFAKAWEGWIRPCVERWLLGEPTSLRYALRPRLLMASLEDPAVTLGLVPDAAPDEEPSVEVVLVPPVPYEHGVSSTIVVAKARAAAFSRASQGDLCAPAAQFAPAGVVRALVESALQSARAAIARADLDEAEPVLALLLAVASGIRESDLPQLVWARACEDGVPAIDPDRPVLYRPVMRPPNAVKPGQDLEGLLIAVEDAMAWPLPASLHALLLELRAGSVTSPAARPVAGRIGAARAAPVLPAAASLARAPYRLWDVIKSVVPDAGVSAGQIRQAMASALAETFGPEVVQMTFGDSFSMSPGPSYYMATPAAPVAAAIARQQAGWFGEPVEASISEGWFGSRLALKPEAARLWPEQLRERMRSVAHRRGPEAPFEVWAAQRDHLAAALLAVTGARPSHWLGALDLDQVVAEYGIVLIRDKAADLLRETRVVAVGRRWLSALREYLDRLAEIAAGGLSEPAPRLAAAILRAEAPLFSVVDGSGITHDLDLATIKASMPEPLRGVANHTRHRLNQALVAKGVSPELRHCQMGWVVMPAHTLADLSHWSARDFGREMGAVLDEVMLLDGWFPASQRMLQWSWRGVTERPLPDWQAIASKEAARHEADLRKLRARLREAWQELEPGVIQRLAEAVARYLPSLQLMTGKRLHLVHASGLAGLPPVALTPEHYELLCDHVRAGDARPGDALESIIARVLLRRIILASNVASSPRGVVSGPKPGRPFFSETSVPSPFLPGLGLAVRQAEAFRSALLARAEQQRAHDQGPLTAWTVAAFSATRALGHVLAAVSASSRLQRPASRADLIRVPAVIDASGEQGGQQRQVLPMVFGGLPALALAQRALRAPTARAPTPEQLGTWAAGSLELPYRLDDAPADAAARLMALLQAVGRLELSGPERLMLMGDASIAPVRVERTLARDDGWPARTLVVSAEPEPIVGAIIESEPSTDDVDPDSGLSHEARAGYARLTRLLDPESFWGVVGETAGRRARPAKSDEAQDMRDWRARLNEALDALLLRYGRTSNLGLLVGLVQHRLNHGGKRKAVLSHATLGSDLTRFSADLLAVAGGERILDWGDDAYEEHYLAVLMAKPETARKQAFDGLMVFHDYLRVVHLAPEIETVALRRAAGPRSHHGAPGMATPIEVELVHQVLKRDIEEERARLGAPPESLRLLALSHLMFVLLEASGARPSSVYGLTVGDLVLLGSGEDYIRIRTTGGYGRAKSVTSLGFVPLEGSLWANAREEVLAWISNERRLLGDLSPLRAPLFADRVGSRLRFSRQMMLRRVDALMKWATSDAKARTYWLRKNRVTARHEAAVAAPLTPARAVYAALRSSGHASIDTPMAHYISDPGIIYSHDLHGGLAVPRSAILDLTGMTGAQLDMAWQRAGGPDAPERLQVVLDRLKAVPAEMPAERLTAPPPLGKPKTLTLRHVADFARAMASEPTRELAILRAGLTNQQADALDAAALKLALAKNKTPWACPGIRHRGSVMAIPRAMAGTERLYALLGQPPSEELAVLAEAWASQPFNAQVRGGRMILELTGPREREAASWLLSQTKLDLTIEPVTGALALVLPINVAASRSHGAALRWMLALQFVSSDAPLSNQNPAFRR